MRDGLYDLHFSAGGSSARRRATVDHEKLLGHDGVFRVEGTIVDGKAHITSSLDVTVRPEFVHNRHVPEAFSVQMSGVASDSGFSLIGTGPLGLIIALEAVKNAATPKD